MQIEGLDWWTPDIHIYISLLPSPRASLSQPDTYYYQIILYIYNLLFTCTNTGISIAYYQSTRLLPGDVSMTIRYPHFTMCIYSDINTI
jgi:hypothetical protein